MYSYVKVRALKASFSLEIPISKLESNYTFLRPDTLNKYHLFILFICSVFDPFLRQIQAFVGQSYFSDMLIDM